MRGNRGCGLTEPPLTREEDKLRDTHINAVVGEAMQLIDFDQNLEPDDVEEILFEVSCKVPSRVPLRFAPPIATL